MSLGPLGAVPASAAGSPLAQGRGAQIERAAQDEADQHRRIEADQKAENASGIGEADGEDHETAERDAHGRRLWGESSQRQGTEEDGLASKDSSGKDSSGQSGNLLDLTG
jgi:hypothetical protein